MKTDAQPLALQMGPFQGITDVFYRKHYMQHFGGIDKLFTPFFSGTLAAGNKILRSTELDTNLNDTRITIPQLLSNDADEIIRFSHLMKQLGYSEINLNMGCPFPQVAGKKRGAGLMPYAEKIAEMLNSISGKLVTDFSIKCRLGYDDPYEVDRLMPVFNEAGLSELIIHARIGKQLYRGTADIQRFSEAIEQAEMPIVYNGDIFDADFQGPVANHKIKGWMLGRGLLSDPFLAGDIKQISPTSDRKQIVRQFIESLYLDRRKHGQDRPALLGRMKELWWYMRYSFCEPQTAWRLIRKTKSFDEYELASSEIFEHLSWLGSGFLKHTSEHSASSLPVDE
jgi:tRNA-dihydrouridine synthase B